MKKAYIILPLLILTNCNHTASEKQTITKDSRQSHLMDKPIKTLDIEFLKLTNNLIDYVKTKLVSIHQNKVDIANDLELQRTLNISNSIYPMDKNKIRLLYTSLNHDKTTLKDISQILNQIKNFNTQKSNILYVDILDTGIEYLQKSFEEVINEINTNIKKSSLNLLNIEQLKDIKNNLNIMEELKETWINFANDIINDYKNNINNIKYKSANLIPYIINKYRLVQNKINNVKNITNNIKKILHTTIQRYYISEE